MRALLPLLFCAALGCGGGGGATSSASFQGTFGGRAFAAKAALSGVTALGMTEIIFTNFAPACDAVGALQFGPDQQLLQIRVMNSAGPIGAGTYGFGTSPMSFIAAYQAYDGSCAASQLSFTTGKVTLDSAADRVFTGSLDLTMNGPSQVTATFNTELCAAISSQRYQAGGPTCSREPR